MRKCFVLKTGMSNRHETTVQQFRKESIPFTGFRSGTGILPSFRPPTIVVLPVEMRDGRVCKSLITSLIKCESCRIVSGRAKSVSRRTTPQNPCPSLVQSRESTRAKNKNYQTNPFEIFQSAHEYWRFSSSAGESRKKRTHFATGFAFRISNFGLSSFFLAACRLEGFLFMSRQR